MKRRQGVKSLIQHPVPFPFNNPTTHAKTSVPFFPLPLSTSAMHARLQYTGGQQILKLRRHLTDHCSQYVFVLIRIIFREVHARGYSIYPWVWRCGPAPHTLTLFKKKLADFPTLFKTEFRLLIHVPV